MSLELDNMSKPKTIINRKIKKPIFTHTVTDDTIMTAIYSLRMDLTKLQAFETLGIISPADKIIMKKSQTAVDELEPLIYGL